MVKSNISIVLLFISCIFGVSSTAQAKKALVIVDMQACFVSGINSVVHSLPVQGGNELVSGINELQKKFDLVVATKDWHPKNHGSFASQHQGKSNFEITVLGGVDQVLWPDHCIEDTPGAEFIKGLNTEKIAHITFKGTDPAVDSYSGFNDNNKSSQTDLDAYLQSQKVTEIYIVGLAADYCVKATAIDGASLHYKTYFVKDLTKAVDTTLNNIHKIYSDLQDSGVILITANDI